MRPCISQPAGACPKTVANTIAVAARSLITPDHPRFRCRRSNPRFPFWAAGRPSVYILSAFPENHVTRNSRPWPALFLNGSYPVVRTVGGNPKTRCRGTRALGTGLCMLYSPGRSRFCPRPVSLAGHLPGW
jgi:hypothetical protein